MPPGGAAEVGVESVLGGIFGEVPFAGDAGSVAFCFERFGDGGEFFVKNGGVLNGNELAIARLATVGISHGVNSMPRTVASGHEAGAGRGTVSRSGVGLGKGHAFLGEAVDVGSLIVSRTLAGEVSVAEVIRVDEDDVGSLGFHEGKRGEEEEIDEGAEDHFLEVGLAVQPSTVSSRWTPQVNLRGAPRPAF